MKTKYICSRESGDNPKVKDFRYSVQGHTPYPPNVLPAENTLALPTMCQRALCSSHSTTHRSPVSGHPDACPTLQWSQQASSSHAHHSQVGMGSLGFPGLRPLSVHHTHCALSAHLIVSCPASLRRLRGWCALEPGCFVSHPDSHNWANPHLPGPSSSSL